jgi:hypothetical protein
MIETPGTPDTPFTQKNAEAIAFSEEGVVVMDKQNIDEVVEHLLATRKNVAKAELRSMVELVVASGGRVVSGYDEDGPWCGTRVPGRPPKVGGLIDNLTEKGFTVKLFPYGIPFIDEAFLQIGRGE